jgi:hypothetical protein
MSLAEVKSSIAEMSQEDRLEVAALIAHLNRADDPAFQADLERRMSAMDAGSKTTASELKKLHNDLMAQGR